MDKVPKKEDCVT